MFETRTTRRGPQIAKPQSFAGTTSGGIPAGTEVVIASARLNDQGCPVLEDLYYNGDSNATNALQFRCTLDGVQIGEPWALPTYNPFGQPGLPRAVGKNLPPGRLFEIRCKNTGTDSTLNAYSDGTVCYYENPV